jgi:hypothetical protein
MIERYLYISYDKFKELKDCQFYENLDEVKKERGITCNEHIISITRIASYSSQDGSGCYLLDFKSSSIDFTETKYANHVMRLIPSVHRELRLKELGIN